MPILQDTIHAVSLKLSLCMIMRNEAPCLSDCLRSVQAIVDEIIIVDTGSTDASVAIAEQHGAIVYHHSWQTDFALARNQSISYARGDWILIMDADERLSQEGRVWLQHFKAQPQQAQVYQTQIVNINPSGQAVNVYYMQRLFPNIAGLGFRSAIHERLVNIDPRVLSLPLAETTLDLPFFYHIGTQAFHIARQGKRQRNFEILSNEFAKFPDDPHLLYHLANATRNLGELSQADDLFQQIFKLRKRNNNPDHPMFAQALAEWLDLQLALNRADRLIALSEQVAHPYLPPSYWYYLGLAHRKLNALTQAKHCFETAIRMDPLRSGRPLTITHEIAHMRQLPLLQLASIYLFQSLQPASSLPKRCEALSLRRNVCLQLIHLFPTGDWPEYKINLFLIVAETLLLEAIWLKQQVHPEAFAKSIQPIFHSQGAFQDVNCAWESISKPTVKSEREYMLLSELWLQGLYYQDDAYHQQIWHHFEGLLADDLIQEYRLMSALFFLRH